MSVPRTVRRTEAERWLAIAEHNMAAAKLCLDSRPLDIAAYHCQQTAEKLAKALLVAAGAAYPKTHDLAALNALSAPLFPNLTRRFAKVEPITVWGTAYRYPPEEEGTGTPTASEILQMWLLLRELRDEVAEAVASVR